MGTIRVPEIVPPPADDCLRLKKAFEGLGTDEEGVIWVLGRRNATQRKQITEAYQHLYKASLLDRINSELSGDFKKAVLLWVYDPAERDARLIREALKATKKRVKQLEVLVEVACTTPPTHLVAVRKAYSLLFHSSIEEDIHSNVASAALRKLLVGLVSSFRYDGEVVDTNLAISEAVELYKCIKARLFQSNRFLWILSTRNVFQLRETFECYHRSFKNPIEQDIKSSGKGDLETVLSLVARCIHKPEMHFAEVIREAIIGIGTDEDSLTRAIVTRAEVDMVKIKTAYSEMYKSTVESAVDGDTSGDYKAFLMTLLGTRL
uniref:Annexin n=1 Tax=Kalanchoe fedtschenkoi TaxID=63787 RepID=A0A7N0T333_KALFE